jgi:hypothetical protein
MQHFRVPFPQVFCLVKIFWHFHKLMKHFRAHPKSRFHSFNILGALVHRFLFVFLPSQTLLKPYHLRCPVCTKLFSSFIKCHKHFRIHYENYFSSCNFFSFLYLFMVLKEHLMVLEFSSPSFYGRLQFFLEFFGFQIAF